MISVKINLNDIICYILFIENGKMCNILYLFLERKINLFLKSKKKLRIYWEKKKVLNDLNWMPSENEKIEKKNILNG